MATFCDSTMIWLWLGFFALVAMLVVLHYKASTPAIRGTSCWSAGWIALGLSFTGLVYLMYEHAWLGATLVEPTDRPGTDASIMFVAAYLLELALSADNIIVTALLFHCFRVPVKYQHRLLLWSLIGAIGFRVLLLPGGAYVANQFDSVLYVFGGYFAYQGIKLMTPGRPEAWSLDESLVLRILRRFAPFADGDHGGKLCVIHKGRRALTTVAVCLATIVLTDLAFTLDSVPAALSVSRTTFILVTSNLLATLALRSSYFALAGVMGKLAYARIATAVLLLIVGAKLIARDHLHVPHAVTLALIAGVIGVGVAASVLTNRRDAARRPDA